MAEFVWPKEVVEKLAWSLWRSGNDRIGYREWEPVGAAYLGEARAALDAIAPDVEALVDALDAALGDPSGGTEQRCADVLARWRQEKP